MGSRSRATINVPGFGNIPVVAMPFALEDIAVEDDMEEPIFLSSSQRLRNMGFGAPLRPSWSTTLANTLPSGLPTGSLDNRAPPHLTNAAVHGQRSMGLLDLHQRVANVTGQTAAATGSSGTGASHTGTSASGIGTSAVAAMYSPPSAGARYGSGPALQPPVQSTEDAVAAANAVREVLARAMAYDPDDGEDDDDVDIISISDDEQSPLLAGHINASSSATQQRRRHRTWSTTASDASRASAAPARRPGAYGLLAPVNDSPTGRSVAVVEDLPPLVEEQPDLMDHQELWMELPPSRLELAARSAATADQPLAVEAIPPRVRVAQQQQPVRRPAEAPSTNANSAGASSSGGGSSSQSQRPPAAEADAGGGHLPQPAVQEQLQQQQQQQQQLHTAGVQPAAATLAAPSLPQLAAATACAVGRGVMRLAWFASFASFAVLLAPVRLMLFMSGLGGGANAGNSERGQRRAPAELAGAVRPQLAVSTRAAANAARVPTAPRRWLASTGQRRDTPHVAARLPRSLPGTAPQAAHPSGTGAVAGMAAMAAARTTDPASGNGSSQGMAPGGMPAGGTSPSRAHGAVAAIRHVDQVLLTAGEAQAAMPALLPRAANTMASSPGARLARAPVPHAAVSSILAQVLGTGSAAANGQHRRSVPPARLGHGAGASGFEDSGGVLPGLMDFSDGVSDGLPGLIGTESDTDSYDEPPLARRLAPRHSHGHGPSPAGNAAAGVQPAPATGRREAWPHRDHAPVASMPLQPAGLPALMPRLSMAAGRAQEPAAPHAHQPRAGHHATGALAAAPRNAHAPGAAAASAGTGSRGGARAGPGPAMLPPVAQMVALTGEAARSLTTLLEHAEGGRVDLASGASLLFQPMMVPSFRAYLGPDETRGHHNDQADLRGVYTEREIPPWAARFAPPRPVRSSGAAGPTVAGAAGGPSAAATATGGLMAGAGQLAASAATLDALAAVAAAAGWLDGGGSSNADGDEAEDYDEYSDDYEHAEDEEFDEEDEYEDDEDEYEDEFDMEDDEDEDEDESYSSSGSLPDLYRSSEDSEDEQSCGCTGAPGSGSAAVAAAAGPPYTAAGQGAAPAARAAPAPLPFVAVGGGASAGPLPNGGHDSGDTAAGYDSDCSGLPLLVPCDQTSSDDDDHDASNFPQGPHAAEQDDEGRPPLVQSGASSSSSSSSAHRDAAAAAAAGADTRHVHAADDMSLPDLMEESSDSESGASAGGVRSPAVMPAAAGRALPAPAHAGAGTGDVPAAAAAPVAANAPQTGTRLLDALIAQGAGMSLMELFGHSQLFDPSTVGDVWMGGSDVDSGDEDPLEEGTEGQGGQGHYGVEEDLPVLADGDSESSSSATEPLEEEEEEWNPPLEPAPPLLLHSSGSSASSVSSGEPQLVDVGDGEDSDHNSLPPLVFESSGSDEDIDFYNVADGSDDEVSSNSSLPPLVDFSSLAPLLPQQAPPPPQQQLFPPPPPLQRLAPPSTANGTSGGGFNMGAGLAAFAAWASAQQSAAAAPVAPGGFAFGSPARSGGTDGRGDASTDDGESSWTTASPREAASFAHASAAAGGSAGAPPRRAAALPAQAAVQPLPGMDGAYSQVMESVLQALEANRRAMAAAVPGPNSGSGGAAAAPGAATGAGRPVSRSAGIAGLGPLSYALTGTQRQRFASAPAGSIPLPPLPGAAATAGPMDSAQDSGPRAMPARRNAVHYGPGLPLDVLEELALWNPSMWGTTAGSAAAGAPQPAQSPGPGERQQSLLSVYRAAAVHGHAFAQQLQAEARQAAAAANQEPHEWARPLLRDSVFVRQLMADLHPDMDVGVAPAVMQVCGWLRKRCGADVGAEVSAWAEAYAGMETVD